MVKISGRIKEMVKGKKYKIIVEAGNDPKTGKRKRLSRIVKGRRIDAEKLYANLLKEVEQGTHMNLSSSTLAEYLRYWLDVYAKYKAPSTYNGYKRIVESHIIPQIGNIPLTKLKPMHIQSYYTERMESGYKGNKKDIEGLSPNTVIKHHRLLHSALKQAYKWEFINRNPVDFVTPPPEIDPVINPLTPSEFKLLLNAIKGKRDEYLILCGLYTGLREGELLALPKDNIFLDSKKPYLQVTQAVGYIPEKGMVFRSMPKTASSRRKVPLLNMAVNAIENQLEMINKEKKEAQKKGIEYNNEHNLVFPDKYGRTLDPSAFARRFKRIVSSFGSHHLRPHDLRHTFATMLFEEGISPRTVQELLGHATISMTMNKYTHVIDRVKNETIEKLNQSLSLRLSKEHEDEG